MPLVFISHPLSLSFLTLNSPLNSSCIIYFSLLSSQIIDFSFACPFAPFEARCSEFFTGKSIMSAHFISIVPLLKFLSIGPLWCSSSFFHFFNFKSFLVLTFSHSCSALSIISLAQSMPQPLICSVHLIISINFNRMKMITKKINTRLEFLFLTVWIQTPIRIAKAASIGAIITAMMSQVRRGLHAFDFLAS